MKGIFHASIFVALIIVALAALFPPTIIPLGEKTGHDLVFNVLEPRNFAHPRIMQDEYKKQMLTASVAGSIIVVIGALGSIVYKLSE